MDRNEYVNTLYYEKNISIDSYLLSKADPELIKQIFKQQQLASEDNRIFSLEVFLKRASYVRDFENLISSFTNDVYRSKTGNRYHFNSTLNIEKLKMLCDCKCVLKIKGGHYGRAVIRRDFKKVILNSS